MLPYRQLFSHSCNSLYQGCAVFDTFVEGAKEGARTAFYLPVMVGILAGVAVLNGSGLIDIMTGLLQKPAEAAGIPRETLPLLLIRPFSGSASLGLFSEQIAKVGADSFRTCTVHYYGFQRNRSLYSCVYFGAARSNTRHAIAASLISSYTQGCLRPYSSAGL